MISTFCFLAAMTDPFDEAGKACARNELFASKHYKNYGRKALERNRTVDLILTMDMLCQLSYKGILRSVGTLSSDTSFVNYVGFRSSCGHETCLRFYPFFDGLGKKRATRDAATASRLRASRPMPRIPKARASATRGKPAYTSLEDEKEKAWRICGLIR
jgi:hypothetical protein